MLSMLASLSATRGRVYRRRKGCASLSRSTGCGQAARARGSACIWYRKLLRGMGGVSTRSKRMVVVRVSRCACVALLLMRGRKNSLFCEDDFRRASGSIEGSHCCFWCWSPAANTRTTTRKPEIAIIPPTSSSSAQLRQILPHICQRRQRQTSTRRRQHNLAARAPQRRGLLAPVQQFHCARVVLNQGGAVFHPVAVVEIEHPIHRAHVAEMDMTANMTIEAALARIGGNALFV